jgi:hypothetical protein
MKYVYLDNFRGFSDTIIPLLDVNFLVGENSTGKTSFLTMLKLFSGPQLYMPEDGSSESTQFGHFEEMVSAHSEDQTYFRLGYFEDRTRNKQRVATGILFTYEKVGGLSKISRITCTMPTGGEVSLLFHNEEVYFKTQTTKPMGKNEDILLRVREWIKSHSSKRDSDWTQIELPPEQTRQIPLILLLAMATSERAGKLTPEVPFAIPTTGPHLVWIAPIRSRPRRTYDEPQTAFSSEGSHIPYVIRRMLDSEKDARKFHEFIKSIGDASGLFQQIEIKRFGNSETSPFEVDAYLDDVPLGLSWLGYGVSQSLPIFVELLDRPAHSWFAIQQPEVHLHPRAQACLGDVFFEMAVRDQKKFVIETHSDFTIDRFRLNYRRNQSTKKDTALPKSQILFFERRSRRNIVTQIPIGSKGELPADQPQEYRNFFIKEEMKILGL